MSLPGRASRTHNNKPDNAEALAGELCPVSYSADSVPGSEMC